MKCANCGYDSVPEGARVCPQCQQELPQAPASGAQIIVDQRIGTIEDGGTAAAVDIAHVERDVNIFERALTPQETREKDRALEFQRLRRGIEALEQALWDQLEEADAPPAGNPYQGLPAYGLRDEKRFFGRGRAVDQLYERMRKRHLTVLHSESGAGKTSLLQAGIMPRLIREGHLPVYLRPYDVNPARAVKQAFLDDLAVAPGLAASPLRHFLRRVSAVLGPERELFILLDQFEEFFAHLHTDQQSEFIVELADCLKAQQLADVYWLIALRADFYSRLARFRPAIQEPFANDYYLDHLTVNEAKKAITEPAARRGVTFEYGLVDTLLSDLSAKDAAPSEKKIAAPQAQIVCFSLYELHKGGGSQEKVISKTLYDDHGRAEGVLRTHLDRVIRQRLPDHQETTRQLLVTMVTADKRRAQRKKAELQTRLVPKIVSAAELDQMLAELVNSRLLVQKGDPRSSDAIYELAHDHLLSEIELDPKVQRLKAAKETLRLTTLPWRQREGIKLTQEELELISPYRQRLAEEKQFEGKEALIVASALEEGHDVAGWLRTFELRPQDVQLVTETLVDGDADQRRQALKGLGSCDRLPARLQAALEERFETGNPAQRRAATEALWSWRDQMERGFRWRLRRARLGYQVRDRIREQPGLFSLLALLLAALVVGLPLLVLNQLRREHEQSIAQHIVDLKEEFRVSTLPGFLHWDGNYLWVAPSPRWSDHDETAWDEEVRGVPPLALLRITNRSKLGAAGEAFAEQGFTVFDVESDGDRVWVSLLGREKDEICPEPQSRVQADGTTVLIHGFCRRPGRVAMYRLEQGWVYTTTVGSRPWALAFDGTRLWVANADDDTLMALEPDTGEILETVPVVDPAAPDDATGPADLAFDGTHLWVANTDNDTLLKLDVQSGQQDFFALDHSPDSLTADGSYVWAGSWNSDIVIKLDGETGRRLWTYERELGPVDLVATPEGVFVSYYDDSTVVQLDPETGRRLAAFSVQTPIGLAFDGANLWVASEQALSVVRFPVTVFPVGFEPTAMVSDGDFLLATNGGALAPIHTQDGWIAPIPYRISYNPSENTGIAHDGTSLWLLREGSMGLLRWPRPYLRRHTIEVDEWWRRGLMTFDGESVWVADVNRESGAFLARIDSEAEALDDRMPLEDPPVALTHGGGALWTLGPGYPLTEEKEGATLIHTDVWSRTLTKVDPAGEQIESFQLDDLAQERSPELYRDRAYDPWEYADRPVSLAFGGEALWAAYEASSLVAKYHPDSGELFAGFPVTLEVRPGMGRPRPAPCTPVDLVYAGGSVWAACTGDNTVQRLAAEDGAFQEVIDVGRRPIALYFDGTALWVAKEADRTLTRIFIDE